ncbi:oligosaccharide flippase family protein [Natronoarchaeum mannanilyticum]|uniref:Polysaccharide biosynthesis protein HsfF n=1 Tax=Natronoarchaeum mannanilyticum TaxID=926360 RepID=A0AAV3T9G2_9EURY
MSQGGEFGLEVSKGFVAKIVLAAIGFLGSIVFARVLGPAGYGSFHVILAVSAVLDNPVSGFGNACKKRISEYDHDPGEILTAGFAVALVGAAVVFAGALVAESFVDYFDMENGPLLVAVVFSGVVFFKIAQPMVAGLGKFGTAVTLDMLRSLFTIPLQLLLVVVFGLGVSGMVYGLTVASLMTVPLTLFVLGVRPAMPSRSTLESLWAYARFSVPNNFVGTAYSKLDVLLLSAVLGTAAAGQYQIALQLMLPATLLASVMGSGLFAEVSAQVSRDEAVDGQITNNVAFASLFAVPLFFGALAMPESIVVTVFGGQYRDAAALLIGLGIYQIFRTQTTQVSSVLSGYDRPDLLLWIKTLTVVTNVALGVVLIYQIGALGVVVATVVAEVTSYVLLTYYARRHVRYAIFPDPLRYQFLAGLVMFAVVELLHRWIGVSSWFELLTIVSVGAAVYGIALIALSDVFLFTAKSILDDAIERYG